MAHANKVEGIYVEVDGLLDTRLGTIGLLSPEIARKTISSGAYIEREVDEFEGVGQLEFKMAYADRTNKTLHNSVMSGLVFHLRGLVWQLKKQALTMPFHDGVRLSINLYPYSFSEAEQEEFTRVLMYRLNGGESEEAHEQDLVAVEYLNVAPESLTPAHCKASFGAMYMYNPWHWLNLHTEALKTVRLPEVIIYAPRLFHDGKPDAKALEQFKMEFEGKAPDPLTFDEMRVSPIAGVTLIDVSYFSSSVRLHRNQATT